MAGETLMTTDIKRTDHRHIKSGLPETSYYNGALYFHCTVPGCDLARNASYWDGYEAGCQDFEHQVCDYYCPCKEAEYEALRAEGRIRDV